jgi:hypothetical protein
MRHPVDRWLKSRPPAPGNRPHDVTAAFRTEDVTHVDPFAGDAMAFAAA